MYWVRRDIAVAEPDPEDVKPAAVTLEVLAVRLNSLQYLREELPHIHATCTSRCFKQSLVSSAVLADMHPPIKRVQCSGDGLVRS